MARLIQPGAGLALRGVPSGQGARVVPGRRTTPQDITALLALADAVGGSQALGALASGVGAGIGKVSELLGGGQRDLRAEAARRLSGLELPPAEGVQGPFSPSGPEPSPIARTPEEAEQLDQVTAEAERSAQLDQMAERAGLAQRTAAGAPAPGRTFQSPIARTPEEAAQLDRVTAEAERSARFSALAEMARESAGGPWTSEQSAQIDQMAERAGLAQQAAAGAPAPGLTFPLLDTGAGRYPPPSPEAEFAGSFEPPPVNRPPDILHPSTPEPPEAEPFAWGLAPARPTLSMRSAAARRVLEALGRAPMGGPGAGDAIAAVERANAPVATEEGVAIEPTPVLAIPPFAPPERPMEAHEARRLAALRLLSEPTATTERAVTPAEQEAWKAPAMQGALTRFAPVPFPFGPFGPAEPPGGGPPALAGLPRRPLPPAEYPGMQFTPQEAQQAFSPPASAPAAVAPGLPPGGGGELGAPSPEQMEARRAARVEKLNVITDRIAEGIAQGASGADVIAALVRRGADPKEARDVVQEAVARVSARAPARAPEAAPPPGQTFDERRMQEPGATPETAARTATLEEALSLAGAADTPEKQAAAIRAATTAAKPRTAFDMIFGTHRNRAAAEVKGLFPRHGMAETPAQAAYRGAMAARLGAKTEIEKAEQPSKVAGREAAAGLAGERAEELEKTREGRMGLTEARTKESGARAARYTALTDLEQKRLEGQIKRLNQQIDAETRGDSPAQRQIAVRRLYQNQIDRVRALKSSIAGQIRDAMRDSRSEESDKRELAVEQLGSIETESGLLFEQERLDQVETGLNAARASALGESVTDIIKQATPPAGRSSEDILNAIEAR